MKNAGEFLTEQFHQWELRGRGWTVYERPVAPESPFIPFSGYSIKTKKNLDDVRRESGAANFMQRLRRAVAPPAPHIEQSVDEPEPIWRESQDWVELPLSLPLSRSVPTPQGAQFLRHVCRSGEPLALEILGTERETVPQFVASPQTATRVRSAIETCFPGIICAPVSNSDTAAGNVVSAWCESAPCFAVAELGLAREVMLPLGKPQGDLIAGVVAAMDAFEKGELGMLQILFEPAHEAWIESMARCVIDFEGNPIFENRADLIDGLKQKSASPLFSVVLRLVSSAADFDRAWELIADLAAPLSALAQSGGNHLLPLHNREYPAANHEEDILGRLSRRSGMLLSMEELIPLILPPVTAVSRRLRRETKLTRMAPERLLGAGSVCLGMNRHVGSAREVWLESGDRVRHTHVIGASGTGKSTFLLSLIQQDMQRGEGIAVIDPHGDLVDAVLGMVPEERIADVVVIDPSDEEFPVGLNILAAHSDFERNLLASDLTSVFRRLSTSWGDQMESVLRNAILAFLESSRRGTLSDLRRFLIDGSYRREFLSTVVDPEIVYFWTKAFPQLTGGKSIGPLLTRLDEFLSRKPIRFMVAQHECRVDFSKLLDSGGILLAKLPQGLIGRENTALLGSLIISKMQMAAMSRQRLPAAQRRDFWCYLDEFQHFITPSMAEILAGARKYRFGLILAHQELRHLESNRDVASAVLSNCLTRVVFKVGDADARALEGGFSHFEDRDLMNLGIGEAICRVERSDDDFNLIVVPPEVGDEESAGELRNRVIDESRASYARSRSEIEEELRKQWQAPPPAETTGRGAKTAPLSAETKSESPRVERPQAAPLPVQPSKPIAPSEEPQVSEAPNAAASKPKAVETQEGAVAKKDDKAPPQLGRGGLIHRDAGNRIKAVAEELGFVVTIESQIGSGGADLLLERGKLRIAVEISVTTPVSHEVGNLLKCLTGSYDHVAFVISDQRKAERVLEKLKERATDADVARVGFYQVETLVAHLRALEQQTSAPESPPPPKTTLRREVGGWGITTKIAEQTSEEAQEAERRAMETVADVLRKPPQ